MDEQKARFDALLKETDLLRSEALLCIGNVRRLTGFVTSIAGAGIPLLAALLNIGPTSDIQIATLADLNQQIIENAIIVQMVMICISMTCVAFLIIYIGLFMQIFTIAQYFREYLSVEINDLVAQPSNKNAPVLNWENWLKASRSKTTFNVGDFELAIEPILMITFSSVYAGLACYVSYISTNAKITYSISGLIFVLCFLCLLKFIRILNGAVDTDG